MIGARNETGTHWIIENVIGLLGEAFIVAHPMVEIIALPLNNCRSRDDSFEIADDIRERCFAVDSDQQMKVIRYQKKKVQVPSSLRVIQPRGCEQHCC